MKIGKKIEMARHESGLSQEALGEKLGLSKQAISKIENNKQFIKVDFIKKISEITNKSMNYFMDSDDVVSTEDNLKIAIDLIMKTTIKKRKAIIDLLS